MIVQPKGRKTRGAEGTVWVVMARPVGESGEAVVSGGR